MKKIVLATNNPNKVREISEIVKDLNFEVLTKSDVGLENIEVEETENTLEGNALLKAEAIKEKLSDEYIVIADDTGLFVEGLNGDPGVHTSRYGGVEHDDERNINKLLKNLNKLSIKDRTAKFVTVIAVVEDKKEPHFLKGTLQGRIATERRGTSGFGYDPVFIPDGSMKTFAEMDEKEKNKISHRRIAFDKLADYLRERNPA